MLVQPINNDLACHLRCSLALYDRLSVFEKARVVASMREIGTISNIVAASSERIGTI